MLWRLRINHEYTIKILLFVVVGVLVFNIYILSIILKGDDKSNNQLEDFESEIVHIKPDPIKKHNFQGTKHVAKKAVFIQRNTTFLATKKILEQLALLGSQVFDNNLPVKMKYSYLSLLDDVKVTDPTSLDLLSETIKWVNERQLFPETSSLPIGRVLNSLCSSEIEKAENSVLGTQLKLLLTLKGGFKAVFKPQWYKRSEVVIGNVYSGKDRHNGEVAAFHLSWLLGLRRVPLTVGRRINLRREVIPVSSPELLKTFYQEGNNTCLYGVCYYCNPQDPVCALRETLEGALILWLPQNFPLKKYRHPWQRTYKLNIPARWELDSGYCQVVRMSKDYSRGPRLLDIIDTAIFDFLIDNGDRHHYEVFQNFNNSAVLLIDNGKSFGNPDQDHIDILAPLYQCCRLRLTTWSRLLWLHSKGVGSLLHELLKSSHIAPVLSDPHFIALDRRLRITIAAVHVCFMERNGRKNVIVNI